MCTTQERTQKANCATRLDAHHLILGKLGPAPGAALRAMSAYGLSEGELARYFGVTPSSIRRLKRSLKVAPALTE